MAFDKIVPQWNAAGIEPSEDLKNSGFTPGYKPPAAFFNWFWHGVSEALTELQGMKPADIGAATDNHKHTPADIGAIPTIALLADGTDLNNVTTPGFYYCIVDAKVKEYVNCPTTYAFYLEVGKHAGTYQRLVEYGNTVAKIYFRNLYAGSWGAWQREYSTCDKPSAGDVGAISSVSEILSTTSITEAALAQENSSVKNYAFSGDSYTGGDLPADSYKYGAATVFKRYAFTTIVLWGSPNAPRIAAKYYNGASGEWSDWISVYTTKNRPSLSDIGAAASSHNHSADNITSGTLPVTRGGTGATTVNGAVANLFCRMLINDTSIVDANTLVHTGIHKVYVTDESVAASNHYPYVYGNLFVVSNMESTSYTYIMQQFLTTNGHIFIRASTNNGSTWTDWNEVYSSGNAPYTASTTDLTAGTSALANGEVYLVYE